MSEVSFQHHFPSEQISKSSLELKTYAKDKLPAIGELTVPVSYSNQMGDLLLCVVKGKGPNLLGHNWPEHLILDWKALAASVHSVSSNQLDALLQDNAEVLGDELGTLISVKVKLHVQPNSVPKIYKACSFPFPSKKHWDRRLTAWKQWAYWKRQITVIGKPCCSSGNGQLRLCGDYKVTVNPFLLVAMSSDFCKHTPLTFQLQHEIEIGVSFKIMYSFHMFVSRVSDNPSITKNANLLLT